MAAKDMVHPESAARNPHTSALVQNVVVLDSEAVGGPPPRPALPPGFDPSFEYHRCVACLAITNERDDSRPDVWNDTESMMQKRRCTTELNAKRAPTNEYHTKVLFVLVITSTHHLGRVTKGFGISLCRRRLNSNVRPIRFQHPGTSSRACTRSGSNLGGMMNPPSTRCDFKAVRC